MSESGDSPRLDLTSVSALLEGMLDHEVDLAEQGDAGAARRVLADCAERLLGGGPLTERAAKWLGGRLQAVAEAEGSRNDQWAARILGLVEKPLRPSQDLSWHVKYAVDLETKHDGTDASPKKKRATAKKLVAKRFGMAIRTVRDHYQAGGDPPAHYPFRELEGLAAELNLSKVLQRRAVNLESALADHGAEVGYGIGVMRFFAKRAGIDDDAFRVYGRVRRLVASGLTREEALAAAGPSLGIREAGPALARAEALGGRVDELLGADDG